MMLTVLTLAALSCTALAGDEAVLPRPEHGLHFNAPATEWDEALQLGNGILGALVWGDGAPLKISLDRTDLWDLRPVPEFYSNEYSYTVMRQWEAERRTKDLIRMYEAPYNRPGPTRIPAGRIEMRIGDAPIFHSTSLSLPDATAHASFRDESIVRVWIHAEEPVGVIAVEGDGPISAHLIVPDFAGKRPLAKKVGSSMGPLSGLGYGAPAESSGAQWSAYEQEGWEGFRFAVYLGWRQDRRTPKTWIGAWSVASSFEGPEPLTLARKRVEEVLNGDLEAFRRSHEAWWKKYWAKSSISVPNPVVEQQWYMDTYKFGAASRSGAPPISLQGPWTADDGALPPWKGDYHHDLNTQLCYWPCYSGNRLEEGLNFLEWLWNTRENCRAWTRRFFDMPGMNVPMTADLDNNQIGGWRQYTHSSTTSAWLSQHFYLHWKYSMDRTFMEERAYPYLRDSAVFVEAVTDERDAEGKRTLPLSSSPEMHNNSPEAWFPTITNHDLALLRWLLDATAELADELGKIRDAAHWRAVLADMPDLSLGDDGSLLLARDYPLEESHRHLAHLMPIQPLGLVDWSQGREARQTIRASLNHLDRLGTSQWTGYSFSWLANIAARARDGKKAEQALEAFTTRYTMRNSFHCNFEKRSGVGRSYRPFTLEGNFAAAAGLQEMLLQSHTGLIEVFPAVPDDWKDCSFTNLRAQGAFLVSAERRDGKVVSISITSEKGGTCRVRSPSDGDVQTIVMEPGERMETRDLVTLADER
jgi:alpha-L-fucosidase 2